MQPYDWTHETDVVVVGAGLAGYCAAYEAAMAGARVLQLEKMPEHGGSTLISSGFLAFAGTDLQKKAGIEDTNERLFNDLRTAGGGGNDDRLLQVYCDHQLETYEWVKGMGITFRDVELSSAQTVPRTHPVDPKKLLDAVAALGEKTGRITKYLASPAERLVRDGPAGRVCGVVATIAGKRGGIRVKKGVVIASGGFTRSEAMLKNFVPHQAKAARSGGAGNMGDGLRMGWALGAGMRDLAFVKGTFGTHVSARWTEGIHWTKLPVYRGALAVNRRGERYVDESTSYKLLGDAVLAQPEAMGFQVFDQDIMDGSSDGVPPFDFHSMVRRGFLLQADTLEELGRKMEVPVDAFVDTVKRYNGYVRAGHDPEFGRKGLSAGYGQLVETKRAPFYAYPCTSNVLATYCGFTVDTGMNVIDVYGEPIAGLYAAGEVVGGFHGVSYMTGTALGKCMIFGRIAGRNAAA
jgi:flavocytochrome c